MNKCLFITSGLFLIAVLLLQALLSDLIVTPIGIAAKPTTGARTLEAAKALHDALYEEQRKRAHFEYSSEERFNWHFIPRVRNGVSIPELTEDQRAKVVSLLEASLSEAGASKAQQVMSLEAILRDREGPERRFSRDPELYYVSFFGQPSVKGRWGWRFEGHHLALNFTLDGARMLSSTPNFYGANPSRVLEGPSKGLRVLGPTEDLARELVTSLDPSQLTIARGEGEPEEVPGMQEARYKAILPQGIPAEKLTEAQRKTLHKLIRAYTGNLASDAEEALLQQIGAPTLTGIQFVWRGGTRSGEGHSYLVYGPTFMINYANFQNNASHIHACLRNLKGEFGLD
jgi:hypothetical protein